MKAPKAKTYVKKCFSSARANMDDRQAQKACNIAFNEGAASMKKKAIKSYCKHCEMKDLINCTQENKNCPFLERFINDLK